MGVPDCVGKVCGDDGAEVFVGHGPETVCSEKGSCRPFLHPVCEGKECGDDGCGGCAESVEAAQLVRSMGYVAPAHRHAKGKIAVMMDAEGPVALVPSGVVAHRKGNAYAPQIALERNAEMTLWRPLRSVSWRKILHHPWLMRLLCPELLSKQCE